MTQYSSSAHRTTAGDIFTYLLLFLMLYVGAFAFLALLFDYVDEIYPPGLPFYTNSSQSMIISVSTLLVVWPVFVVLSWLTGKWMNRDKSMRQLAIRKWLIYLTLFASAVTLIIDLIVLIYNFLSGGLTMAFALKVVAVLLVAGAIFGYYLWDLRRSGAATILPRIFAIIGSVLLLTSIVVGFFIIGTPSEQRAERFDERRVSDLQSMQAEVFTFYSSKETLPATLDELTNDVTGFVVPTDPDTKQAYTYAKKGDLTFELCATFGTEQTYKTGEAQNMYLPYGMYGLDENWSHPAGLHCYERTIDPDRLENVIKTPTL